MINLEKLTGEVVNLCRETGHFIKSEVNRLQIGEVEVKSQNSFVTWVDKSSEERLTTVLKTLLLDSGFITEEETVTTERRDYTWIIDPLDGTTNFIHGLPVFCISIGLMKDEQVILGVVYEINLDECFYAWKGGGAWMNGRKITVTSTEKVIDSLMATGFPYYDYGRLENFMNVFKYCLQHSQGLRRLGSAAADLAYVACGRFEGFFEYGLSPWDVAAGMILVQEAGGKVSGFHEDTEPLFGKEIIATNGLIHNELEEIIRKFF